MSIQDNGGYALDSCTDCAYVGAETDDRSPAAGSGTEAWATAAPVPAKRIASSNIDSRRSPSMAPAACARWMQQIAASIPGIGAAMWLARSKRTPAPSAGEKAASAAARRARRSLDDVNVMAGSKVKECGEHR